MKYTEEKLKKISQYASWLSEQLDELCISQSELGTAVGKSQKTISRYVNADNMPDGKTGAAIAAYIEQRSVDDEFMHIRSKEFSVLLTKLFDEFDITQSQLAEKIGKHQKNISNYIYCTEKADTKTQKAILETFLDKCMPEYSSIHINARIYLEYLLYGNFSELIDDMDDIQLGRNIRSSKGVQYILAMPAKLQKLIIDNFEAFYDNCVSLVTVNYRFDFEILKCNMELFRQLSENDKKEIVHELEKDAFMGYPESEDEYWFFKQINSYRKVIDADVIRLKQDTEKLTDEKEIIEHIKCLENAMNLAVAGDNELIEEVKFKLTMTKYEWYVWMLFLIYQFKGKDLSVIYNKMIEMIHNF